jgi:VanZ family protein
MSWGIISKAFFIIIALSILLLSLLPLTPPGMGRMSDKVTHLIAYSLLSASFMFAFASMGIPFILLSFISVTACTVYGGCIEVLQQFTGRSPELLDFFADFLGSVTGTIASAGFLLIMRKIAPGENSPGK